MTRSKKETEILRELEKAPHYFAPDYKAARQCRESKTAQQIAEMRAAAGGRKATSARDKARAAKQVAEMRAAAGHTKGPAK